MVRRNTERRAVETERVGTSLKVLLGRYDELIVYVSMVRAVVYVEQNGRWNSGESSFRHSSDARSSHVTLFGSRGSRCASSSTSPSVTQIPYPYRFLDRHITILLFLPQQSQQHVSQHRTAHESLYSPASTT